MSTAAGRSAGVLLLTGVLAAAGVAAAGQVAPWGEGADAEIEHALLNAEVVRVEELGTGITRPKKITLSLGGRTIKAVWKDVQQEYTHPPTGSARYDDMFFSDRWQHEVAAYRIDRLIRLDRVPVAVVRAINGRTGSLQAWIDDAFTERDRVERKHALSDPDAFARDALKMHVFDALIYNVDRTQENILIVEPGSRVWLIDHSRAFRLRRKLPRMKRDSAPPTELLEGLAALTPERVEQALSDLLTPGQIKAILARRDRLLQLFSPR